MLAAAVERVLLQLASALVVAGDTLLREPQTDCSHCWASSGLHKPKSGSARWNSHVAGYHAARQRDLLPFELSPKVYQMAQYSQDCDTCSLMSR